MWIRCENGEILNGDRCDRFSTGAAAQVREVNYRDGSGKTYSDLPETGWLLLAHRKSSLLCVARYETKAQADHALKLLFEAMTENRSTFAAPRMEKAP